jgi:hypothetical protein
MDWAQTRLEGIGEQKAARHIIDTQLYFHLLELRSIDNAVASGELRRPLHHGMICVQIHLALIGTRVRDNAHLATVSAPITGPRIAEVKRVERYVLALHAWFRATCAFNAKGGLEGVAIGNNYIHCCHDDFWTIRKRQRNAAGKGVAISVTEPIDPIDEKQTHPTIYFL